VDFSAPSYAGGDISSGETLYNFNMVIPLFIYSFFFQLFHSLEVLLVGPVET